MLTNNCAEGCVAESGTLEMVDIVKKFWDLKSLCISKSEEHAVNAVRKLFKGNGCDTNTALQCSSAMETSSLFRGQ